MSRMQSIILAAMALGGISTAAVALKHPAPVPQEVACLAIGPGVCLSGTVSWVVHAAAQAQRSEGVMIAMAGDVY